MGFCCVHFHGSMPIWLIRSMCGTNTTHEAMMCHAPFPGRIVWGFCCVRYMPLCLFDQFASFMPQIQPMCHFQIKRSKVKVTWVIHIWNVDLWQLKGATVITCLLFTFRSYGVRVRQDGNIRRLTAENDDEDMSTYNGNSTQQMWFTCLECYCFIVIGHVILVGITGATIPMPYF